MAAAVAVVTLDIPHPNKLQDSGAGERKLAMMSGIITITGDYVTGGVSVGTSITKYFRKLHRIVCNTDGWACRYDKVNNKILLYGDQALASLNSLDEPNAVTGLSVVVDFIALGV
jgi:hypothetical protein